MCVTTILLIKRTSRFYIHANASVISKYVLIKQILFYIVLYIWLVRTLLYGIFLNAYNITAICATFFFLFFSSFFFSFFFLHNGLLEYRVHSSSPTEIKRQCVLNIFWIVSLPIYM